MLKGFIIPRRLYDVDTDLGTTPPQPETPPPTVGDDKRFTQAELDAAIKDRLDRAARKAEKDKDEAERKAKEQALKEQGEYKTLADQREKELADANDRIEAGKAVEKQLERYKEVLTKYLESQRKELTKPITDLLDKLDVADQLEWIAANRESLSKPNDKPQPPNINANTRSTGKPNEVSDAERERAANYYRNVF